VKRPIEEFFEDDEPAWVARLSCGHTVHRRHQAPFVERPWVLSEAGRRARVGSDVDCVGCDRMEIPEAFEPYRRTRVFTADTVPAALASAHSTRRGVWGLIHVEEGELEYERFAPLEGRSVLAPGTPGVVVPEVEHKVTPRGPVSFCVEFWRRRPS